MNIVKFLASRRGALSKVGVVSLGLTVGLVGLNFYNYVSDSPAAQDQKVRNLASILAAGGQVPAEYSSINVKAGGTRFATAEERAKYEGAIFDGGDAAEARLNGITVRGRALGTGEAGLGMGGNEAVEIGTSGSVKMGDVPDGTAVGSALAGGSQGAGAEGRSAGGPTLQRATMAHAGGSNLGSGSGMHTPSYGTSAGVDAAARSLRSEGQTRITPSISGAMPQGSTLVSSKGFQGARSASFKPANGSTTVRGQGLSSSEGKGLRRIAVNSGKVAADKYRRTNAGTDPLMNEEYQGPGLTITGDNLETLAQGGTGDDSFEDLMNKNLDNLNTNTQNIEETELNKKNDRGRLWATLIGLTCATFVAMLAIQSLTKMGGFWGWAGAVAVAAAMAAAITLFIIDAVGYGNKYKEWGMPVGMFAAAAIMAGGIAVAFIKSINGWLGKVSTWFGKNFGTGLVKTGISAGAGWGVKNMTQERIGADDDKTKLSKD